MTPALRLDPITDVAATYRTELLCEFQVLDTFIRDLCAEPDGPKSPFAVNYFRIKELWPQFQAEAEAGGDVRWHIAVIRQQLREIKQKVGRL